MGQKAKLALDEQPFLAAQFSQGTGVGLRQQTLDRKDRKFLSHIVGLSDHDVAHIAQASKPRFKDHPEDMMDFTI